MIKDVIILPVGSTEYHGALLPAATDAIVAERVAHDIAERMTGATLLPTLPYGVSSEHADFNETVTISASTYLTLMTELLNSLARPGTLIVIINGHGGNTNLLNVLEAEYNYAHSDSKVFFPSIYAKPVQALSEALLGEFDTHAGSTEASLMAHYLELEKHEESNEAFVKRMSGSLRFFRTAEVNPSGVIKDTERLVMDPNVGKKLHDEMVATLTLAIKDTLADINKVMRHEKK